MKKQLLIAAIAASMTSVAMADISIGGAAKFNSKNGVYSHEADLKVKGTSGATSVAMNIKMDGLNSNPEIEDAYVSTAVAGVKVKMGGWRSGKNELGQTSSTVERVNASTSFGGISLAYEDVNAGSNSTTVGGSLAGVKLSHKIKQSTATETKASGSIGGVAVKVHSKESAAGAQDTSVTLSTDIQGVTLTYSRIDSDSGTKTDGYIGKDSSVTDADAIGVKTSIAGNTVQFKSITMDGTDTNKVVVTRGLSAGATFELVYADTDGAADPVVDLELAVKF